MRYLSIITLLGLALLTGAIGQASNPPDEVKVIKIYCPIVGLPGLKTDCGCPGGYCSLKPSDKGTLEYQGGQLRFCCGRCAKMFKEMPAKFAVTANHQLVATKQAKQVKCPNCGSAVAYAVPVDIAGVPVGFCPDCRAKVIQASAEERLAMAFGEKAFARGFVVNVAQK